MKGYEILSNWNHASELIKKVRNELGNIGWFLRRNGYKVEYEGFSVCHFEDKEHGLRYVADCCSVDGNVRAKWELSTGIHFETDRKWTPRTIEAIDPQEEYDTIA